MLHLTNYRTLGKSGLRVSPFTLGTMTFGQEWGWGTSPAESQAMMSHYIDAGGNVLDTADVYTKGHSEQIVGDYLKKSVTRRDQVVLSTKFFSNLYPGDPNAGGTSRKAIIAALEQSLRRLQTDYIDLYWMHAYDKHTPIEETMAALHYLVESGKVRYIGVSDTPAWKIAQGQLIAQFRGWSAFVGLQLEYSLLERTVEGEQIPMAQELGLGEMPWSPLKEGLLSGKYTRANQGTVQSGRNHARLNPHLSESTYQLIDQLTELAEQKQVSPASIALAWVVNRPGVTSTIVGARTVDQLKQNLTALSVGLTEADLQSLNSRTEPTFNFPVSFLRTGVWHLAQGGTTINDVASEVPAILPQHGEDVY